MTKYFIVVGYNWNSWKSFRSLQISYFKTKKEAKKYIKKHKYGDDEDWYFYIHDLDTEKFNDKGEYEDNEDNEDEENEETEVEDDDDKESEGDEQQDKDDGDKKNEK